jgi:hypothetical protein
MLSFYTPSPSLNDDYLLSGHCYTTYTIFPGFHVTLCHTSDALVHADVPLSGSTPLHTP